MDSSAVIGLAIRESMKLSANALKPSSRKSWLNHLRLRL